MLGSGGVQISMLFILIQYFVDFLSQNASDDVELMLLGNKSDVDDERKVTFQQGAKVKSKSFCYILFHEKRLQRCCHTATPESIHTK